MNQEIEEEARQSRSKVDAAKSVASTGQPESGCYRLGPFSQATSYEIAKGTLMNAGVEFTEGRRAPNRSEVYRVFVGPFVSRAEAVDARTELSNKGVLDHFIRDEPNGGVIVSLGIFTSQETADMGLKQVSTKIEQAKLREEVVTLPQTDWLYFSLAGDREVRRQIKSIDWSEPGAQLGAFSCQR